MTTDETLMTRGRAVPAPRGDPIHHPPGAPPDHSLSRPPPFASLHLHIEDLILHGFNASDRYRVADAVERELGRLLMDQLPKVTRQGDIEIEQVDAGRFSVRPGASARDIGGQVAQSVLRSASKAGDFAHTSD